MVETPLTLPLEEVEETEGVRRRPCPLLLPLLLLLPATVVYLRQ